jgi:WD40 repeat protein
MHRFSCTLTASQHWSPHPSLCRWQASAKAVRNVDFSGAHSDGVLFTCDEAGACRLWDAANGDEIAQLEVPPGGFVGVEASAVGRRGSYSLYCFCCRNASLNS